MVMAVSYHNITSNAIRTGSPRIRLPFQSHNECQIIEEDYVQKAADFANATRLSESGTAACSVTLSGGGWYSVAVTEPGSGYTAVATLTAAGDGSGAVVSGVMDGDRLGSVVIVAAGTGYTSGTCTASVPDTSHAWQRSANNFNALMVEEGASRGIGCGLVQFTRVFAEVPPQRIEYEQVSYQQPAIYSTATIESKEGYSGLFLAKATYDYFLKTPTTVDTILLSTATHSTEKTPTLPTANSGDVVLAADDSLSRWMGDIWERKSVEVTIQ